MDSVIIKALFFISTLLLQGSFTTAQSLNSTLFATKVLPHITRERYYLSMAFSPLSVYNTLSIIYLGAKEKTADEIYAALRLPEADREIFPRKYREYLKSLKALSNKNQSKLLMANRFFYNEKISLDPQFQRLAQTYFNTEVENANFTQNRTVVKHINEWVEQHTEYKIKNNVGQGRVYPSTGGVLADTIYFKAKWKHNFENLRFLFVNKTMIKEDTLVTDGIFNYMKTRDFSAVEVPFENPEITMLMITPNANVELETLENNIAGINLLEMKMRKTKVTVQLPKISIVYDDDLDTRLSNFKIPEMWWRYANLTGIFHNTVPKQVERMQHKVYLNINSEGVEAAAATFPVFDKEASNQDNKNILPFVFFIRSKQAVYFAGHVIRST